MQIPPEMPKEEEPEQIAMNERHVIDIKLRKAMKDLLSQHPALKPHATQIN